MADTAVQTAKVMQLFALFANLRTTDPWRGIAESAIVCVENECKDDADRSDIRLCYYAAAIANLRYRQLIAAQGVSAPTYAGAVNVQRDDSVPCTLAQRLVSAYRDAAADLLKDNSFCFRGIC